MTDDSSSGVKLLSASSGWVAGLVGGAVVAVFVLVLAVYLGVASFNVDNEQARRIAVDAGHRKALENLAARLESLERSVEATRTRPTPGSPTVVASDLVGEWYDGSANCMTVAEGSGDREYLVKAWHCASGEPDAAIAVTAQHAGASMLGDKRGRMAIRLLGGDSLVASFRYPPPNDRHMNMHVLFRRVTGRGVR